MLFKTATSGRTQTSDEEQGETDEDEHGDEEENADEQGDLEGDEELDVGNEEHDDGDDEDDDDNDDNEDDDEDEELNVGRFARVKRKCLSMHLQGTCSSLTLLFFFREQEVMNVLLFAQSFTNSSLYFKISFFGCFILPIRLLERGLISIQNFLRI